ncbi:MAG: UDP-N-acetylmuramoyl-tripeptide--D-alanyl-D-alanine ligase [Betaproteobacteria bacterium]|nr:UDP-N-acetylmuramoyl-tripeptide--D-alanyl-D-alanine ligase [Betaproteobacteria bacterium]
MLSTHALAQAIGGVAHGADVRFESVTTDSRAIPPRSIFIALRGERFDGHAYAHEALQHGAIAVLADTASQLSAQLPDAPIVEVRDTKAALGRFAKWWRAQFVLPVIGVVGSNGKTTVKKMIAAILRAHFGDEQVLATRGNLNNDIGLPQTLLDLRTNHRVGVIEIGMNHPGETALLAAIAQPTIGLINNAQREHQEFMQSVAEVAIEHGALIAALSRNGTAIINADDAHAAQWRALAHPRAVRSFGVQDGADVTGRFTVQNAVTHLFIALPEGTAEATLHIPGMHNVQNALAAAAAASVAGANLESIGRGLSAFRPAKGRLQRFTGARGELLIDDTYNANPDSVRAAIDILAGVPEPRILILGDMGEVGANGEAFHIEVGRYAREQGVNRLLALGEMTKATVASFGLGAEHFSAAAALMARMHDLPVDGTTILVKGSRFMRMERVIAHLRSGEATCS